MSRLGDTSESGFALCERSRFRVVRVSVWV